ncbi:T9SS type A sorting domain-containing protein [bacterium]
MKNNLFYLLLLSFLIIFCIKSSTHSIILQGGEYKIVNGIFNQGGQYIGESADGLYSLHVRMGFLVGNIFISGGEFSINPTEITSTSNSGRLAALDLSEAHVYPNPFKLSKGHTHINFTRLPARVEILIYTVSGELFRTLNKDDSRTDEIRWDIKNETGEKVFSGVYLYLLRSNEGKVKTGKLLIIR